MTSMRLYMCRATYKTRMRLLPSIQPPGPLPPTKDAEEWSILMGTGLPSGPPVDPSSFHTDSRVRTGSQHGFTRTSFGVNFMVWYPIFAMCFSRGDKLSCIALRDTNFQLKTYYDIFRRDISRLVSVDSELNPSFDLDSDPSLLF